MRMLFHVDAYSGFFNLCAVCVLVQRFHCYELCLELVSRIIIEILFVIWLPLV